MIYRFRIVLDTLDDVFRDIEIQQEDTLESLHNAITQSFGFEGHEMASFYISDENWSQGEEIALFDMSEELGSLRIMNETAIDSVVNKRQTKLIYVYDFLDLWTFYVELADIVKPESGMTYPNLMYAHGIMPENPPEKKFESEAMDEDPDFYDDEFGDNNIDLDDLDNIDFDQWN